MAAEAGSYEHSTIIEPSVTAEGASSCNILLLKAGGKNAIAARNAAKADERLRQP